MDATTNGVNVHDKFSCGVAPQNFLNFFYLYVVYRK